MDKDIFVSQLKSLAPSEKDLKKHGLSDEFINSFIASYICKPKPIVSFNYFSNDEILKLLQYYDCSKVEIGIVTFVSEIIEQPNYFQIGNIEQDILALNKTYLNLDILDFSSTNHVIWKCASNSEMFLEALLLCAEYFTLGIVDATLLENKNYRLERVKMCSEMAGGDEYINFYKMLLGYFD